MSGVLKSIGKIFKAAVVKPIKFIIKTDHKVAMKIWHTPILRYIAIAVAVYFTAGAAMAYFGAAGAAGGVTAAGTAGAAAGAAGTADVAIGAGIATADVAGGAAFATGAAAGAAVGTGAAVAGATALGAVNVTADVAAASAGVSAGTVAAVSVGTAATAAQALQAGHIADNAMTQGNGTVTGTPGVTDLTAVQVNQDIPAVGNTGFDSLYASDSAQFVSDLSAFNISSDPSNQPQGQNDRVGRTDPSMNANGQPKSLVQKGTDYVKDKFGMNTSSAQYDENGALISPDDGGAVGGGSGGMSGVASKGGMSTFEKLMLMKSGVDLVTGYLKKPEAQQQYSGYDDNGNGTGIGIHTINNGFGLAVGGSEPSPTGVNPLLRAPSQGVAPQQGTGTAGVSGVTGAGYSSALNSSTYPPSGNPGLAPTAPVAAPTAPTAPTGVA